VCLAEDLTLNDHKEMVFAGRQVKGFIEENALTEAT